jgi:hypothetical protein
MGAAAEVVVVGAGIGEAGGPGGDTRTGGVTEGYGDADGAAIDATAGAGVTVTP